MLDSCTRLDTSVSDRPMFNSAVWSDQIADFTANPKVPCSKPIVSSCSMIGMTYNVFNYHQTDPVHTSLCLTTQAAPRGGAKYDFAARAGASGLVLETIQECPQYHPDLMRSAYASTTPLVSVSHGTSASRQSNCPHALLTAHNTLRDVLWES